MNVRLFREFLQLYVESLGDANVPNQLVNDESRDKRAKNRKDEVEDVNEFSGVGAIAGYTAPLGAGAIPYYDEAPKPRKKNKK